MAPAYASVAAPTSSGGALAPACPTSCTSRSRRPCSVGAGRCATTSPPPAPAALLPGDAFEGDYGGPYDLILVTNFFHRFDPPTCERLLRKIFAALAPGGRCVNLDFVIDEGRVSPPTAASFAMMMLGTTIAGDV